MAVERLRQEISQLWAEEGELRKKEAGHEPDGQGSGLAKVFRTTVGRINLGLAILLALVIEAGSSLGLFIVMGHGCDSSGRAEKTKSDDAEVQRAEPLPLEPAAKVALSVEDYWLERLFPALGEKVSVAEVVEDYCAYCERAGVSAMAAEVFEASFRGICARIVCRSATVLRGTFEWAKTAVE